MTIKSITPGLHRQIVDMGLHPIVCACGCNAFAAGMDLEKRNETAGDVRLSCIACGNWTLWFRPNRDDAKADLCDDNQLLLPTVDEAKKGIN